MTKLVKAWILVALIISGSNLQKPLPAEYSGSSWAKTLTLEQTTDDQPDEIIPDVDSTLIPSVKCQGVNWNDHPEATDFPDVRAWPGQGWPPAAAIL